MNKIDRQSFGETLRNARHEKKYTQQECALYCDVSVNAYQFWERGLSEPKAENRVKICKFLGIDDMVSAE